MNKLFILLCAVICFTPLYAQNEIPEKYQESLQTFLSPQKQQFSSLEKVVDSIFFRRINQSGSLRLEQQDIFLYDSLAREIREFNFQYDLNEDTLLFVDQFNSTYPPLQIIESSGKIIQNQYTNTGRKTENFRNKDVLESTLEERWDIASGAFVNEKLTTHYFIPNTDLVDSIITQIWDSAGQKWLLNRWDFQYFGNDDLRDSVYTYTWNTTMNAWNLSGKITSQYDALAQLTNLNLFQWDSSSSNFELLLEVFEFYNGDPQKDSTHVYSYFGGYYGETLTIFSYENDLVAYDTIYTWDGVLSDLSLANYQSYQYDTEGDLTELRTYTYNSFIDSFFQITQVNYYYSTIEVFTQTEELLENALSCVFANPYTPGEAVFCDFGAHQADLRLRLYDLKGHLYLDRPLSDSQFRLEGIFSPGLYLLVLEEPAGRIHHFKLIIQP